MRESQIDWLNLEWLARLLLRRRQPEAQVSVHHLLERLPGLPNFLVEQGSHIVIESKSGAHIMMLPMKTS